tara:strand:+ start:1149 stop:2333 length:1185 start_codon:yes stop_codon:yes gene_type:complete
LIFQTLDSKNECVGVYAEGQLHYEEYPSNLTATWGYAPYLSDNIEFAFLYAGGKKLGDMCPSELKEEYDRTAQKLKSYLRSFRLSRVDLGQNCFFDLVPRRFLLEYYSVRNKITEHVLKQHKKPDRYDFLLGLTKVAHDIKSRKLNVDSTQFAKFRTDQKTKAFYKKLNKTEPFISYNIFGTVTGRFTVAKKSFPILTFPKKYRKILKPNNDRFVEFDYNAAELRTLLALSKVPQPQGDIHGWIVKHVFGGSITREESKIKTFAWLYNSEAENYKLEKSFNKEALVSEYWKDGSITNPFGRTMQCERKNALNYLIQSTTSDLFLYQMIEVFKMLENRKSYISFCMHDSLVIDFSTEDKDLVSSLYEIFSKTKLGRYKTNISLGRDYGSMRKMDL